MILPSSYGVALLLIIFTMLCWGSWANTFKLAGKWRFELFYYDYAVGVVIMATIAALTFGSMGDSLTFVDNMMVAGYRKIAYAFVAGVVFNLANMLLVAAIAVAGMAVAFPVGIGLALVVGVVWSYFLNPQGNPILLATGVAIVLGAIVVDAIAYQRHTVQKAAEAAAAQGSAGTKTRKAGSSKPKSGGKGIALCIASGILMGSFYPLVQMATSGEDVGFGLGAYSVAFVFSIGVLLSTFVFNLYFVNLPVQGKPIPMTDYFKGTGRQHLLGIAGGLIWCAGTIANFAAASSPKEVQVGPAISYAIGQGATMVSALWGLLVWREFAGASPKVRLLLALMLILFVTGLTLISIAPLFAGR